MWSFKGPGWWRLYHLYHEESKDVHNQAWGEGRGPLRQFHGPSLAMAILPALPQLLEYLSPDHTPLQERGTDHCSLSMCQEERELSVMNSKPLCPISNIWYVSSGYSRHLWRSEDSHQFSFPLGVPDVFSQFLIIPTLLLPDWPWSGVTVHRHLFRECMP